MTDLAHEVVISPYGDSAILISRDAPERERRWAMMQHLSAQLRAREVPGVQGIVATFETMLVEFDPLVTTRDALADAVRANIPTIEPTIETGRVIHIPLLYGGDYGPDLTDVAHELELTEQEVIDLHSSTDWRVAFNGAPAGTPLHDGSPFDRPIRRMPQPRIRIAEGTVALSGFQGTIYTVEAPGGWRLIGRTPIRIVNQGHDNFVAIDPGDTLRFDPISEREFENTPPDFIGDLL